jgi:hypothetical protein
MHCCLDVSSLNCNTKIFWWQFARSKAYHKNRWTSVILVVHSMAQNNDWQCWWYVSFVSCGWKSFRSIIIVTVTMKMGKWLHLLVWCRMWNGKWKFDPWVFRNVMTCIPNFVEIHVHLCRGHLLIFIVWEQGIKPLYCQTASQIVASVLNGFLVCCADAQPVKNNLHDHVNVRSF